MAITFSNLAYYFQTYGIMDFLLPFILVFTIVFAVLQRTKILGDKAKNFNVVVALVLGLIFVVPHVTGTYPLGYDPVSVMNNALPSISLISIAAIMLLLLMGIFGAKFAASASPVIAVVAIGFVIYVFGAALGLWTSPSGRFNWWDSQVTELIIIILVFGVIVWFITKEEKSTAGKDLLKGIGSMFEKDKFKKD